MIIKDQMEDKNCNVNQRDFNRIKVMITKANMITNIDKTSSINKNIKMLMIFTQRNNQGINTNSNKVIIINNKMTIRNDKTSSINKNMKMVMIIMLRNRIKVQRPDFPLSLPSLTRETREVHSNPRIPASETARRKIFIIRQSELEPLEEEDQTWGFLRAPTRLRLGDLNTRLRQFLFMVRGSKIENIFAI